MLGHHYWNGNNEEEEREMVSETKYLPLRGIRNQTACYVIKRLLDKNISHRMTLEEFMVVIINLSCFIVEIITS